MRYVENEGAVFRIAGPSNAFPSEVFDPREGKFVPYDGDVPKPPGWGSDMSEEEVREFLGSAGTSGEGGDEPAGEKAE